MSWSNFLVQLRIFEEILPDDASIMVQTQSPVLSGKIQARAHQTSNSESSYHDH